MSTREDMKRFYGMDLDFGTLGLQKPDRDMVYFCTPEGAEPAGSLGVDGIHFVLLPGDERVFCVDPSMMSPAYVLPVAEDFRTFLSYLLSCKDANVLSQISWMSREQYQTGFRLPESWWSLLQLMGLKGISGTACWPTCWQPMKMPSVWHVRSAAG